MPKISEYQSLNSMPNGAFVLSEANGTTFKIMHDTIRTDIQSQSVKLYQGLINAGKKMIVTSNGDVKPQNAANLIVKIITANGEYNASDDNADGYEAVIIDVGNTGIEYKPNTSVYFNVTEPLIEMSFDENGIYYAVDDGADAYSKVTVNV